jgi:hypothetical protein
MGPVARRGHTARAQDWDEYGPRFGSLPNSSVALDLNRIPSPLQMLTTRGFHGNQADSQLCNQMCVAVHKLEQTHTHPYVQWRLIAATVFCLWNHLHKIHHYYGYAVSDVYVYRVPNGLTDRQRFRIGSVIPDQVAEAFGIPLSVRMHHRMRDYDDGPDDDSDSDVVDLTLDDANDDGDESDVF